MQIGLACDHAGFELKEELKPFEIPWCEPLTWVPSTKIRLSDFGALVTEKVLGGWKGDPITRIGMSIVANKFPKIRAALANDLYSSRCSREHNDANILIVGGRIVGKGLAKEIVKIWLETPFAGGRHKRRLEKIEALEKEKFKE
jgi:ribose 5-phosphate isomerase B